MMVMWGKNRENTIININKPSSSHHHFHNFDRWYVYQFTIPNVGSHSAGSAGAASMGWSLGDHHEIIQNGPS
jgi:hypothetical protein